MKQLTAFLFCGFFSLSFSQTWIENGAEWHYDWTNVAIGGFIKINYVGDTLIDGQNCQKLEPVEYTFAETSPTSGIELISQDTMELQFTYNDGDTVFYRLDSEFFVLYNFGATVGDQWVISTTNPGGGFSLCDDTSRLEVIGVGTQVIESVSYRYIDVEPTSNSPYGINGRIIERFGNIGSYLFPLVKPCDSLEDIVEFSDFSFKCFKDDSLSLYNPSGEDCEYLLHLNLDELSEEDVLIYPNPVHNLLNVSSQSMSYSLVISNSAGKTVYLQDDLRGITTVDLESYETGVYFLQYNTDRGSITKKIVKL